MSALNGEYSNQKRRCGLQPLRLLSALKKDRRLDDVDLGGEVARHFETNGLLANLRFVPNLHWRYSRSWKGAFCAAL